MSNPKIEYYSNYYRRKKEFKLVGSLISHEDRIRDTSTTINEKAFASQVQISKNDGASNNNNNKKGSGRGQN